MSPAAAISARNTRPRTAKRSATTKISRTFLHGNIKATARSSRRNCIESNLCSKPSSSRRGATNEIQTQSLATEKSQDKREAGRIPGDQRFAEHVVSRNARRGERGAHRERRRTDRVRFGLPRGHLRDVLADDQRRGAWARPSGSRLRGLYETV